MLRRHARASLAARLRAPCRPSRRLLARELGWWALAPKLPARGARRHAASPRCSATSARRASLAAASRRLRPSGVHEQTASACSPAALRLAARDRVRGAERGRRSPTRRGVPLEGVLRAVRRPRRLPARAPRRRRASGCWRSPGARARSGPARRGAPRHLAALLSHLAAHPLQARAVTVLAPVRRPELRATALGWRPSSAGGSATAAPRGEPRGAAVRRARCGISSAATSRTAGSGGSPRPRAT